MKFRYGLAIAEVLVAMGLLAIIALGVMAVFMGGLDLMARSEEVSTATEVGREFLERTRFAGHGALPVGSNSYDGFVPDSPTLSGFPGSPYPVAAVNGREYTLKVTSEPVVGTNELMLVRVEVHWDRAARVILETHLVP